MLTAILGAGMASRFGADKLMTLCAGKPLGQWALEAALTLGGKIAWIGNGTRPAFLPDACSFHVNASAASGLGTSLALAARIAQAEESPSLLVLLGDMPLITPTILKRVVDAGPFAACRYGDRPGVPALFPPRLFGELAKLDGDRGAAPILRGASDLALLDVDPESLLDVDTPADLKAAQAVLARSRPPAGWLDPFRRRKF